MLKKVLPFLVFLSIIIFTGCSRREVSEESDALSDYMAYACHHLETYDFDPKSPLATRITNVPEAVLVFLRDLDGIDYEPYIPTSEQIEMIESEMEKLSPLHQEVMREKVVGFYFIKDLWGSGLADFVVSEDGEFYSYVVFNPGALTNSLEYWLTYKENTCFIPDDTISINISLGESETAISYIVAHELTHAVDYTRFITPYVEPATLRYAQQYGFEITNMSDFVEGVWSDYFQPIEKFDMPYRDHLDFYGFGGGPFLHATNAIQVYSEMEKTPFASLYGNLIWAEDLTEFMSFYHLTQVLNYDYNIQVMSNDQVIYSYRPMENPLVRERFKDIEVFYGE